MWNKNMIPDLSGKVALVTGSNTGIGYETALALYEHGARVIVASRNREKAEKAADVIKSFRGRGSLLVEVLDLSSLHAIQSFADAISGKFQKLDILINNAGVMMTPPGTTAEGYELQFGVNFLGHFALTGRLLTLLKRSAGARVVTLTSGAATFVDSIDFGNLRMEKVYDKLNAYAVSKLADLQFAFEFQRRLDAAGASVISVAAHPGVVRSDLQRHIPKDELEIALSQIKEIMEPWQGALPALYAATNPTVKGGDYYGPDGEKEQAGYPGPSGLFNDAARDPGQAKRLWEYAQVATGVLFP